MSNSTSSISRVSPGYLQPCGCGLTGAGKSWRRAALKLFMAALFCRKDFVLIGDFRLTVLDCCSSVSQWLPLFVVRADRDGCLRLPFPRTFAVMPRSGWYRTMITSGPEMARAVRWRWTSSGAYFVFRSFWAQLTLRTNSGVRLQIDRCVVLIALLDPYREAVLRRTIKELPGQEKGSLEVAIYAQARRCIETGRFVDGSD